MCVCVFYKKMFDCLLVCCWLVCLFVLFAKSHVCFLSSLFQGAHDNVEILLLKTEIEDSTVETYMTLDESSSKKLEEGASKVFL